MTEQVLRAIRTDVPAREPLFKRGLLNVMLLATLAGTAVAVWVLVDRGGWEYYRTPLAVRGYAKEHQFLQPSGFGGQLLGITGTLFLLATLLYVARKRLKFLSKSGSIIGWLEVHVFCGLFGPILITFHTSFKFNGIISVAYWSMVLVVLSGFVGRYLFVRIPKTIRGTELDRAEIEERAREMKLRLADTTLSANLLLRIEQTEKALTANIGEHRPFGQLVRDKWAIRRELAALRNDIRRSGVNRQLLHEVIDLVQQRLILLQRIAQLKRTRRLFQAWHVFHKPLVWVMFVILAVHVAVAIYFGYTFFGQ